MSYLPEFGGEWSTDPLSRKPVDANKTVNSYLTKLKTSAGFKFKLVTEEDIFNIISRA